MSNRRRRSKKWIGWLLFLILVVGAAIVIFLVRDSIFGDEKEDSVEEVAEVVTVQEDEIKEKSESELEDSQADKEEVVSYDGENPNEDDSLTGVVTFAGVADGVLMIRVNIDQFLPQGTCNLVLEKDGAVRYEDTAQIIDSAATATCEGFNVSVSALESGDYKIIIKLEVGEKKGTINGEVSL